MKKLSTAVLSAFAALVSMSALKAQTTTTTTTTFPEKPPGHISVELSTFPAKDVVPGGIQYFYEVEITATDFTGPLYRLRVKFNEKDQRLVNSVRIFDEQDKPVGWGYPTDYDDVGNPSNEYSLWFTSNDETLTEGVPQKYRIAGYMSYEAWDHIGESISMTFQGVESDRPIIQSGLVQSSVKYTATKNMTQSGWLDVRKTDDVVSKPTLGKGYWISISVSGSGPQSVKTPVFEVTTYSKKARPTHFVGFSIRDVDGKTISTMEGFPYQTAPNRFVIRFTPIKGTFSWDGRLCRVHGAYSGPKGTTSMNPLTGDWNVVDAKGARLSLGGNASDVGPTHGKLPIIKK